MKEKVLVLLVVLVNSLSIVAQKASEKFVFTPQWTAHAQFAGYYVAMEKGFYKQAGLDVEIVHPSVSQTAMNRLQNRESQATTLQLCQALEIVDKGVPLVNILQTSMNNGTVIISRRDKDPLKQIGARVGMWYAGFSQVAICMSRKEHLNYQWVRFTSNMDLFLKGAIDGTLAMSYNEYYQLLQMGFTFTENNVYRFSDHGYNIQEDGVYMRRDYYETHKAQAHKFAQASRKGWEWAANHPEETIDIVMKYVRANHIATNRTLQKLMLKEVLRLQIDKKTNKREFRLRPDMVKFASQMMKENQMLNQEVTYKQLIAD
ncbi:ABC transporter substrate-binding protein [Xylanibacter ruminicola]|uniref:Thiamine pyrimidine synthase n=1 Tax=Xylanibacter ruminicola TaxID=839 RepID=A0A1M6UT59_XYLRU|nr:ABC transporter substrate-binding protein [Xylanibacter ruminicola]SHK72400.1 NitT/TauT family transport system substrate-binding protein [Xylanibacter ruminicola]